MAWRRRWLCQGARDESAGRTANMIEKAIMDAQVSAREFYVKLGYVSEGEEFIEANIPHVKMFKWFK